MSMLKKLIVGAVLFINVAYANESLNSIYENKREFNSPRINNN